MTTATATIRYRRTKQGEWVAYGPASALAAGCTVVIGKADGTSKEEYVERLGRPFAVDGVEMVYGYLGQRTAGVTATRVGTVSSAQMAALARTPARRRAPEGYTWEPGIGLVCDECGDRHRPGDGTRCWETGQDH